MAKATTRLHRRQFLKRAAGVGAAMLAPQVIPGAALGKDGAIAASERIVMGAIGIGRRGGYDLGCFLPQSDVQFVAVCDVKAERREAAKKTVDAKNNNSDCATYRDLRELLARKDIDAVLIATGSNWHCLASILAAKAGKDVYCEKPVTKNIVQSLTLAETFRRTERVLQVGTQRRSLPHFAFAVELARRGKLGKLLEVHAHPGEIRPNMSGWAAPETEPPKEEIDWDLCLGPAAWRPYNKALTDGFHFEKGGGMVGGGILEWGSHCVDLCQWANNADGTAPVAYHPLADGRLTAHYKNGVKLVIRLDGWLGLGSCPVRFEGENGWVETGDCGKLILSSPELLAGREVAEIGDYPATFHVRNFLDCVKTRRQPRGNADVACWSHIACHATNISLVLKRELKFDTENCRFVDDSEANRLRSEAIRAPWQM